MGDQAVWFQQVADKRLFHYFFTAGGILQIVSSEFIVIDSDILVINAGAIEMTYRLAFQFIKTI